MNYLVNELNGKVETLGRTLLVQEEEQALYFNWTMSGFRIAFEGTKLEGRFKGIPMNMTGDLEDPYIAVRLDDKDTLEQRIRLTEGVQWVTLFEDPAGGRHTLEVLKLSENARGKAALLELRVEGHVEDAPEDERDLIEFVGDSITCGYGNEAPGRDAPFLPQEENGFISYAALTARALNMKPQLVSVSGITVAVDRSRPAPFPFKMPAMEELYPFADRLTEEKFYGDDVAEEKLTPWNFEENRPKILVLNLGTNDVNIYKMGKDLSKARAFFHEHYRKFIETFRRLNGPDTYILCVLGTLDYYLYDEIRDIVNEYIFDTKDERIECFKFIPVLQWSENYGAVGHPSAKTHERMARELAEKIRSIQL